VNFYGALMPAVVTNHCPSAPRHRRCTSNLYMLNNVQDRGSACFSTTRPMPTGFEQQLAHLTLCDPGAQPNIGTNAILLRLYEPPVAY